MIEVKNLVKTYTTKSGTVRALDGVSLNLESTGMVFILGKSGSGKSTLLNVLGGLDKYDSGEIIIKGRSSASFSAGDFDSYRNTFIGFIFQEYNILDEFTVGKNISLALELQGKKSDKQAVEAILQEVDLVGYAGRKPNTLSGGQKQRVAIARALIKSPEIIMADEPTGALDSATGKQVFDTLKHLSQTKLVLVVSHDREFAETYGDRVIELKDGQIISDISKYIAPPETINDGVSVVDNKIISIKAGHVLTAADANKINALLQNANEDIVISVDGAANKDFKRLARIDDSGNKESFANTTPETQDIKTYGEGDFSLIRSRLPFKDSVKIGASGLKAKPFRLFLTIFLSMIAFAMFGIVDTLSAYDKFTATKTSMEDTGINYSAVTVQIPYTYDYGRGEETDYASANMTDADLAYIKSQNPDLTFMPVYNIPGSGRSGFDLSYYNMSEKSALSEYGSYYTSSVYGFVEITESELKSLGFTFEGTLPSTSTEIAISKYLYDQFAATGYSNYNNSSKTAINKVADLLGKELYNPNNSSKPFKITAVIDTKVSSRYDDLKTPSTGSGDISDMLIMNEFNSYITTNFHTLFFTGKGFYDANYGETHNYIALSSYDGDVYRSITATLSNYKPSDEMLYQNALHINKLSTLSKMGTNGIYWLNGEKTTLADDEVVLGIYDLMCEYVDYEGSSEQGYSVLYYYLQNQRDAYLAELVDGTRTRYEVFSEDEDFALLFPEEYPFQQYMYYVFDSLIVTGSGNLDYYTANLENLASYAESVWTSPTYYTDAKYVALREEFPTYEEYKTHFVNTLMNYVVKPAETLPFDADFSRAKIINGFFDMYLALLPDLSNTMYLTYQIEGGGKITYTDPNNAQKFKVVGYHYDNENYYDSFLLISDNFYSTFDIEGGRYSFALTTFDGVSESAIDKLINFTYIDGDGTNNQYRLVNAVTSSLSMVNSLIETLAKVLLYVGLGIAVFAALILFNYISISISYKKREIGVLRAVGARGTDVFGIFFNEALIISLINFILAAIVAGVTAGLLNNLFRNEYGLIITLLSYGIRQIAIMLGISVLVAFISSFLPVFRVSKMKPIDAIRKG